MASARVADDLCLERHGDRRGADTGSQTTQRSRSRTCGTSGAGTRSALPDSMNTDATEKPCGTCGLPLYGAPSCVVCDRAATYARTIAALVAPKGAYKVLLASVGNPDFRQDSRRSLPGVPRRTLRVASLTDASKACRAYIAHYELGGGNWLGGEVKSRASTTQASSEVSVNRSSGRLPQKKRNAEKDGVVVARISYNGRAWDPGDWRNEISLTSEVAS